MLKMENSIHLPFLKTNKTKKKKYFSLTIQLNHQHFGLMRTITELKSYYICNFYLKIFIYYEALHGFHPTHFHGYNIPLSVHTLTYIIFVLIWGRIKYVISILEACPLCIFKRDLF